MGAIGAIMDETLQNVLERLSGVRKSQDGFEARCPAHDDERASLSVGRGDDGRVLLHCHAGCEPAEVCQAIGLTLRDLFAPSDSGNELGRIIATYDYRDAQGKLLFQVVRFHPKTFRQRRPDGRGGWINNLRGVRPVLYRLPELLAADRDGWILVTEGEKDADRLVKLGFVATTCPMGAGKWSKVDDAVLEGKRVAIIPDNDGPGRKHAEDVAMRLQNRARAIRVLELPGDGKDISDWFDAGGTVEGLRRLVEAACDVQPPPAASGQRNPDASKRPNIFIDTEEYRVVAETIAALTVDPNLYQRGGMLVRVIRDRQPTDGILRCEGSATIQAIPAANLRERMTRFATFSKLDRKSEEVAAHPAAWLVSAVEARAEWEGIRHLMGVSDAPILRPDGSIWQQAGYDAHTGVLFEPAAGATFPPVHDEVNIDDAEAALSKLLEVVCDFPFESDEHKAAWLAALLTPLARFAFTGPSPLFLIDANVRGAGKSLLAQTVGRIVLGREMPVSSYTHDSDELRKRLTSIAIAGDRIVLFDNLEGSFGNDALDRALTSTRWKDRILGKSEEVELPLLPTWYATGNNIQVAADTLRRIIHIRLDCLRERPEERSGFQHGDLLAWLDGRRGELLAAGLTILSAYLKRGHESRDLKPFGSFEGWSAVVRQAVVWVGLPDPCLTRTRLAESADTTGDALGQLIGAWRQYDTSGTGVVVSDMLRRLYPSMGPPPEDGPSIAVRAALENLVGCPPGKAPTPRQVGNRLRRFRRRVMEGEYLDSCPDQYSRHGAVWKLHSVDQSSSAEDARDCDSTPEDAT
jgi:hypothetical protein